jgi:RND family efflux transporter MFP subunit
LLAAVLAGAFAAGCAKKATGVLYHCPMHPTVISDHPGDCPICGMKLVPVHSDETAPSAGPAGMAPVIMTDGQLRLAGVQTVPARTDRLIRSIRAVGVVVADETRVRSVQTKMAGWVEKLYVNSTGQAVAKGKPLLSIYSPELLASQEEFLRARATAAQFANSAIPEVKQGGEDLLQAARRRLQLLDVPDAFVAQLEQTQKPQRAVTLTAPVSGFVTVKQVREGQQVQPGMELFTVADLSQVWVEADVYEYEARGLRLGDAARLTSPYDATVSLTGKVAYIYPYINSETRALKARFEVPNKDLTLKPAMYVNVELQSPTAPGAIVPDSAVLDTGERQIVFVETAKGRFEPRQIRVSDRSDGLARVESGLAAGEAVAVQANFLLDSESRLRAAIAGAAATPTPGAGGAQ